MIPRELIKGTLKYMVLNRLQTQLKMYGYEITQVLDEKSSGRIKLTFAALYPVLHKLDAEGLVRAETENVNNRTRKYYFLTHKGGNESDSRMSDFRDYIDLMKNLFY